MLPTALALVYFRSLNMILVCGLNDAETSSNNSVTNRSTRIFVPGEIYQKNR